MRSATKTIEDRAVLLLVNGMGPEQVERFCIDEGGCTPRRAKRVVIEARKRITIAAQYTRVEEIGKSMRRLNDMYGRAVAEKDFKTALQAQREINRLLDLYGASSPAADAHGDESSRAMRLIEAYVKPLRLVGEEYPVAEHVRVAVELIRLHGLQGQAVQSGSP